MSWVPLGEEGALIGNHFLNTSDARPRACLQFHFPSCVIQHLDGCQGKHSLGVLPAFPLSPSQTDTIPVCFLVGNYEIKVWCCLGLKPNQKLHGDFCP